MSTATKTKKTYVVMHPDGTWSKRVSVKDTVYTAAIVRVCRLAKYHELVIIKGARDSRRMAADYRAKAGDIRAGTYEYLRADAYIRDMLTYTYQHREQPGVYVKLNATDRERADIELMEKADLMVEWARACDERASTLESKPEPAPDAVRYDRVEYRSNPAEAERVCDRLNAKGDPIYYWHVAGVHLVPDGTKPAEYAEALRVPF